MSVNVSITSFKAGKRKYLFLWYGWPEKGFQLYFQLGLFSKILIITNLQHAASSIWICPEPEFRHCLMKLCGSDNHYTRTPLSPLSLVRGSGITGWLSRNQSDLASCKLRYNILGLRNVWCRFDLLHAKQNLISI